MARSVDLRTACAAGLLCMGAAASGGNVRGQLGEALEADRVEAIVTFLRAWQDSALALSSFDEKADLLHEIAVAIHAMPRRGDPTREMVAKLRDAAGQGDYLLHFAVASMSSDLQEKLEHSEAAMRSAPDRDWYSVAAGNACFATQDLKFGDAGVDCALSRLQNPSLSGSAKAYLDLTCGSLMLQRASLVALEAPCPTRLELARERLREARERAEGSVWVWTCATNQLARLSRILGDADTEERLLKEVIAQEGAPSTQKALAYLDLARMHETRKEWSKAMEHYEAMLAEDYRHAVLLSFDVWERLRELQQKAAGDNEAVQ